MAYTPATSSQETNTSNRFAMVCRKCNNGFVSKTDRSGDVCPVCQLPLQTYAWEPFQKKFLPVKPAKPTPETNQDYAI